MSILSVEQHQSFEENGYLILRNLIEPEVLDSLKRALLQVIGGNCASASNTVKRNDGRLTTQLRHLHMTHPLIQEFIYYPKLGAIASVLMNHTPEVRLWHDQIIFKPARIGGPVAWHQDYFYWQHTSAPDMVTAWCAITNSTPENGCMYVVPGSHRWGLMENRYKHEDNELEFLLTDGVRGKQNGPITKRPLVMQPSDVSFHHPMLIHGSYNNDSDEDRLGYVLHYLPAHLRYVKKHDTQKEDGIEVLDGELIRGNNFVQVWPV